MLPAIIIKGSQRLELMVVNSRVFRYPICCEICISPVVAVASIIIIGFLIILQNLIRSKVVEVADHENVHHL